MNKILHLYRISQNVNNDYDTYDSAVVAAFSECDARSIHPDGYAEVVPEMEDSSNGYLLYAWCLRKDVKVEYIGEAASDVKRGVVCSSFNAG